MVRLITQLYKYESYEITFTPFRVGILFISITNLVQVSLAVPRASACLLHAGCVIGRAWLTRAYL